MIAMALSLTAPALASGWECEACCQSAGLAGCPTRLRLYGDGSRAVREGPVWRVKGLWFLDCDQGISFEEGSTVAVSEAPRPGEILRLASPPSTVRCFQQTCADQLPQDACIIEHQDSIFRLVRCSDQQQLSSEEMRRPRATAQRAQTPAPRSATRQPSALRPIERRLDGPLVLPEPPTQRCQTSELVAQEADRRLVMGDAARVTGDLEEAIQEYLAALAMDRCSVNGWSALGMAALSGGRLSEARVALRIAVNIDQSHYGAMTALGETEERLGQNAAATAAYQAALRANPSHAPAMRGLSRVQGTSSAP